MPLRWFKPFSRVPNDADTESLEDAWSVDDVPPDADDGVSFFPKLSLVTYQDDEPTWCLAADSSPAASRRLSETSRSSPGAATPRSSSHHELVPTRIVASNETYHVASSPNGGTGEELDPNAASRTWSTLHCHLDANVNFEDQKRAQKQLLVACVLCLVFMMGEAVGGYLSNSLAIMTDAAHLMSDFTAFLISLFAIWLGKQRPSKTMSFGYYRAEALGALTSIVIIWIVSGVLVYMAVLRLMRGTYKLEPDTMIIVAAIGVLINIVLGVVLHGCCDTVAHHHHHHHHHPVATNGDEPKPSESIVEDGQVAVVQRPTNINIRAAFIHVLGDLVQSIGVLIAAFIIRYKPEWKVADPICTFLFSGLVILTTVGVLKDTVLVLMESTPKLTIDAGLVKREIIDFPGVKSLHDFHLWSLTVGKHALNAHVVVDEDANNDEFLKQITHGLRLRHPSILSSTIQVEKRRNDGGECRLCVPA